MKLLQKIIYAQVLMMVMVIWAVPMSYGHDDVAPVTDGEPGLPTSDGVKVPVPDVVAHPHTVGAVTHPHTAGDVTQPYTAGAVGHPHTTGAVAHPDTAGDVVSHPHTVGAVAHPHTAGDVVAHPHTVGAVAHPHTAGAVAHPHTDGDVAHPHTAGVVGHPHTVGHVKGAPGSGWLDARATFYGDINGGKTQQGACGYGDLHKQGYGLATAALSTALFNNGYSCGACYEIKCANSPQWCLPGTIKITATNFCPPDNTKTKDVWCNPPQKHFDLSQPMFLKIAKYKAGVVPVRYRRVPCKKTGGVKFEIKGNPHFLMILPYNVGGAGDIKAMQIKGTKTQWITMKKNWGQIWNTGVVLTGQRLSFRITTSDGRTKDFIDVTPPKWGFNGQSFDGKINF